MNSGVRTRCNSCGICTEDPLVGHSSAEWDDEMVQLGWAVDRRPGLCLHYCPSCLLPFAMMLAALTAAEST